jgi:uncharacterized protein
MRRQLAIVMRALLLVVCSGIAGLLVSSNGALASGETSPPTGRPQSLPVESLKVITRKGTLRFSVMIARDDKTREIGLMYRRNMKPHEGMIFDFQAPQPVAFWMHDTLIPLDIIFIDPAGKILNIAHNARPMDETPLPSAGPARAVLEINAGLSAHLGIHAGDRIVDDEVFHSPGPRSGN